MQIKKTYNGVNPELLYDELKDFIAKQGAVLGEAKLKTYSFPGDSSSYITRGTMTFKDKDKSGTLGGECVRAHIVGLSRGETKVMIDIDDKLFLPDKVTALEADIDFIFGSYEPEDS